MKARVKTQDFASVLHKACSVISKKQVMPILSHILIKTKDNALQVTATDLEHTYIGSCPAQIEIEGEVVVPAIQLFYIVRNMDVEEIPLCKNENNQLDIKTPKSHFSLLTMDPQEFPTLEVPENLPALTLPLDKLKETINNVIPCTASDPYDYIAQSIACEKRDEELRFVATDRRKLACSSIQTSVPDDFPKMSLISGNVINKILSLIQTETVSMGFNHNIGVVQTDSEIFFFRLTEGSFPAYEEVIPTRPEFQIQIDTQKLKDAINRVKIVKPEIIKFTFEREKLTLFCKEPEIGEAREEVPINNGPQTPQSLSLIAETLPRLISPLHCDSITLSFTSPEAPCTITTPDNPDYISVFMPAISVEVEKQV